MEREHFATDAKNRRVEIDAGFDANEQQIERIRNRPANLLLAEPAEASQHGWRPHETKSDTRPSAQQQQSLVA